MFAAFICVHCMYHNTNVVFIVFIKSPNGKTGHFKRKKLEIKYKKGCDLRPFKYLNIFFQHPIYINTATQIKCLRCRGRDYYYVRVTKAGVVTLMAYLHNFNYDILNCQNLNWKYKVLISDWEAETCDMNYSIHENAIY